MSTHSTARIVDTGRRAVSQPRGRAAAALLAYVLTTLLVFLSLISRIDSAVLLEPADMTSTARDYWAAERLGESPFSLERDTLLYAPEGQSRSPAVQIANFVQPAFVSIARRALGYLGALNVYMLLGFALTAWAMFLLLDRLRLHVVACFFGGLVFGFSWWQYEQAFYGHIGLNHLWILPLLLLALLALRRRRDVPAALAAGATLGLSFYLFSYLGLFAAGLVLVFALVDLVGSLDRRRALLSYAIAGTVTLASLFPALLAAAILPSGFTSSFPTPKELFFGASVSDYVIPSSRHPGLGELATWLNGGPHGGETVLFFGWVVLALAAVALICWRRWSGQREEDADRTIALSCAALLLPFGILMSLPAYASIGGRRIPLPDAAYVIGTFLNWWKIYARLGVLVGFGAAILAAFALHVLLRHRRAALLVSGLFAVTLFELYPHVPDKVTRLGDPAPSVRWLAKQPAGTVAHYPMTLDWRDRGAKGFGAYAWRTVYDQTVHGHPLYAVPALRPDGSRREAIRLLSADLERELTPGVLRTQGVRYVVVHDHVYRGLAEPPPQPARGLTLREEFGSVRIYSVDTEPVTDLQGLLVEHAEFVAAERGLVQPVLSVAGGVNPEEIYRGVEARWMTQDAQLDVKGSDPGYSTRWRLVARAFSNGIPRRLELRDSNGEVLGQASVGQSEEVQVLGTFTLRAGIARLRLVASPGPMSLGGADTRRGSVFLIDIRAVPLPY